MRDLLEAGALFVRKRAGERHAALDAVNETLLALHALLTVFNVNAVLSQTYDNAFERPLLAPRVERHSHRHATAERREQQRVRIRTRAFAARRDRFVSNE